MDIWAPWLRTLTVGVILGAATVSAIALITGNGDAVESAVAADAKRQSTETSVRRTKDGRFAYVTTTFAIPPGATNVGEARCPKRAHLSGAFGSGDALVGSDRVTLPAEIDGADSRGDANRITDDGARALIENTTSVEAAGRVEAMCALAKTGKR